VLQENISNQERDKMKMKFDKELQIKDSQLFDMNKKLKKVEQQLVKSTTLVNKLTT
jgi:hypothetical protein